MTIELSKFEIDLLGVYTGYLLEELDVYKFDNFQFREQLLDPDNATYRSVSDFKLGSNRIIAGAQPTFHFKNHSAYLMYLQTIDLRETDKEKYDAMYFGIGFQGNILSNLSYNIEGAYELGKSPPRLYQDVDDKSGTSDWKSSSSQSDVKGWAGFLKLNYLIDAEIRPIIFVQAAVSSGDSDRLKVNTSEGNSVGDDEMFKSFSPYFVLGFSARPEFSNMQAYSLGTTMAPITGSRLFRKFFINFKVSTYMKNDKNGLVAGYYGISGDFQNAATKDESYLGSSVDLLLNWSIVSDLTFVGGAGLFFPGSAFTDTDVSGMYQIGLSLAFL
jgi:hypothetical protein